MAKTLIDIDEAMLARARALIGTGTTKKDAINRALARFVQVHEQRDTIDWIIASDPVADLRDPDVRAAARR